MKIQSLIIDRLRIMLHLNWSIYNSHLQRTRAWRIIWKRQSHETEHANGKGAVEEEVQCHVITPGLLSGRGCKILTHRVVRWLKSLLTWVLQESRASCGADLTRVAKWT
jgi:hypothetical protein